jgi:phosphoribosylformylglycinamidine cyclo-ligase
MYNTFNMGIGFTVVLPPEQVSQGIVWFQDHGLAAYAIGEVVEGKGDIMGLS